jgi:hypothetical protein
MDVTEVVTRAAQSQLAKGNHLPAPNPIKLWKACGGDGYQALEAAIVLFRIREQAVAGRSRRF